MNKTLAALCEVRFGAQAASQSKGRVAYLQVRQFDENGQLSISSVNEFIAPDKEINYDLLQQGDILFVGKGSRQFAWCYDKSVGPAVASSAFYILRPKMGQILPEYLTTVLNAAESKALFQQIGGGTNIFSIRKPQLTAFEVPILPISKQRTLASLTQTHQQWLSTNKALVTQKENLYQAIISKSLK